jgi:predicted Fe-S protein YdhL (DUF1289 family)
MSSDLGKVSAGSPVPSPCTSVCRMDEASGWCEGCARTLDEIMAWPTLSDAEKAVVWTELPARHNILKRGSDASVFSRGQSPL